MKIFRITLLLILCSLSSIGQVNKLGYPIIRNFTPEENGGEEQNWSICQDNRGIMYFGNSDAVGVLEYDGKTWRNIPIPNNSYVRSLAKDDDGTIYVGAVGDFGYLSPDSQGKMHFISLYTFKKESVKVSNVWKTYYYKGRVLFYSGQYIFLYDKKSVKIIDCGDQTINYYLFPFVVNEHIYIGSYKKGLKEIKGDSLVDAPKRTFFENKSIYFMIPDGADHTIVGTQVGFFRYNQITGETSPFNDKSNLINTQLEESAVPYQALVQPNGNFSFVFLYSANYNYLELDKDYNPYEALNVSVGLKDASVSYLYRSAENTSDPLWLTHFYGISRFEIQSPFRRFGEESGLNGLINDVIRFNGELYVGTMNGLFKQTIENGFIKFIPTKIAFTVWSFGIFNNPETGKKSLLIATDSGIYEVNEKGQINTINDIFNLKIVGYKIYQSKLNPTRVYIGEKSGLTVIDFINGKWVNYKERFFENELKSIKSIGEDINGNLWLETYVDGIARLSDNLKKLEFFGIESGLPTTKEIKIFNYKNTLYFGTNKGLYIYDYDKNKFSPTGLPYDSKNVLDYGIYRMVKTSNGFILATNKNSYGIELAELDSSGKYSINEIPFKRLPNKFSDAVYNDNGIIWISCAKELYSYNPNIKRNYKLPYNALVRSVKVLSNVDTILFNGSHSQKDENNRIVVSLTQNTAQNYKLPYRFNRLLFEFSATFYEKEEETQFSCYLDGFDENWTSWSKKPEATYTNLREGNYTFKVKARNIYGTESTIAEYKFSISPPWYRTILAYIIYGLFFIAFVWILVRWNTRRLVAEKEALEQIVKERTAEVVAQKDEIEIQSEKISIQNEEIKSSIHYASRIQNAILTPNEQIEKIFNEFFILFLPRDIVSGDFYWITKVGTKKICVVADCTGHGVPGGFMSMLGMSFISQIIGKGGDLHPGDILNQLRTSVINSLHQTGEIGSSKDGMDIAIFVIDEETNILEFSGANNPLVHIRNNELNHIKSDKMPIGIHMRANEPFTNYTIELLPGDCIYTFSDGYVDQFGGPDQRKFMIKNFKELLLEIHQLPMAEQRERLHKNLLDWHGDSPRIDDVVVMGVRI